MSDEKIKQNTERQGNNDWMISDGSLVRDDRGTDRRRSDRSTSVLGENLGRPARSAPVRLADIPTKLWNPETYMSRPYYYNSDVNFLQSNS